MAFFNASSTVPRPCRLSHSIRHAAEDSLNGMYGLNALDNNAVSMDEVPGFDNMDMQAQYNAMILKIVTDAPIRITPWERVSGSANLGLAISHLIPATYHGKYVRESVSHVTLGFDEAIRRGIDDYEHEIRIRLTDNTLDAKQHAVLNGIMNVIHCMRIWHNRYQTALVEAGRKDILEYFCDVPFKPASNFKEAVQALWFLFSFTRLCGNWPGLGRIDMILGPFLERELEAGSLSLDDAREFLASLFVKGCEWITQKEVVSGDGQHYQNIVLAGTNPDGNECANTATRLILEILEELPIGDFPVAVRVSSRTPDWLWDLIARNTVHGGGVVAIYNEDLIISSLVRFGYSLHDARKFANDGCWEVQIPGETCFGYLPFDAYALLQKDILHLNDIETPAYGTFGELYHSYCKTLCEKVSSIHDDIDHTANRGVCSVIDLLEKGCIEKARGYYDHGPRFTVRSPHIGGFPDVVNALCTIREIVYGTSPSFPHMPLQDFCNILRNNWQGEEALRRAIRSKIPMYGNDDDNADNLAVELFNTYLDAVEQVHDRAGILRPAGASTFGRQINWAPDRFAAPHGFKDGVFLASNMCPTPDTDTNGSSAVIRSFCKLDISRLTCGTALELKLNPQILTPEHYSEIIQSLFKGFTELGGFFLQIDVIDNEILKKAQKDPDSYRTLTVRISGWSARFVTLNRDWQNMIIERTTQQS